jgi:esterase
MAGNRGIHRFATVRGLRAHWLDYGGDGELVVGLHGLVQTARIFDPLAPVLVPKFRLVALDVRGRGQSEWDPQARYRMDHYFQDLKAFLSELQTERVSLIGNSMGGWISMMFASAYPERVTRLVLIDCAIGADPNGLLRVAAQYDAAPPVFENFNHALDWFVADRPWLLHLRKQDRQKWVRQHLTKDAGERVRLGCDPAAVRLARQVAERVAVSSPGENELVWEQCKKLTMPVLFLRGELSDVIRPHTVDRLQSILPQVSVREIPRVGHAPTLFEPETQQAIREFFAVGPQNPPRFRRSRRKPPAGGAA